MQSLICNGHMRWIFGFFICIAIISHAHATVNEPLAFPQNIAGIAAYINTNQPIDLEKIATVFSNVEDVGDNYILGVVPIPNWGGNINVHLYADKRGWMIAYLKKDEPVSMIMQWSNYGNPDDPRIGVIESTTLRDALYKAAGASNVGVVDTDIKYYDFEFPDADEMMIAVKTQAIEGSSIMQLKLPAEYTIYEAAYYHYTWFFSFSYWGGGTDWTDSLLKVDNSVVSDANTYSLGFSGIGEKKNSWWRSMDEYKGAIKAGKLHTIEISHTTNNDGSSGAATVIVYRSTPTRGTVSNATAQPISKPVLLHQQALLILPLITPLKHEINQSFDIIGLDRQNFPKVNLNVFIDNPCAISGGLSNEDFRIEEDGQAVAIDNFVFLGRAAGQRLDLAVVFDDTGSMGGEISAMQAKVGDLIDQIQASGIDARYTLVSFKDHVSLKSDWTDDPKAFKKAVDALIASGGEDKPEASLDAIENVLSRGLRSDAQKVILVITDAPAHFRGDGTSYSNYTMEDVVRDLTRSGVIFIPVSPLFDEPTGYVDLRNIANEIQSTWIDINSADFSVILESFKEMVTRSYLIEYKSPNLQPSTKRTVTVTVNKPGCAVGETSISYTSP